MKKEYKLPLLILGMDIYKLMVYCKHEVDEKIDREENTSKIDKLARHLPS